MSLTTAAAASTPLRRGQQERAKVEFSLLFDLTACHSRTVPEYQSGARPSFSSSEQRSHRISHASRRFTLSMHTYVESTSTAGVAAPSITVKAPKDNAHQVRTSATGVEYCRYLPGGPTSG